VTAEPTETTESPAFAQFPYRRPRVPAAGIPQPMAVDALVEVVSPSRTLVVRPAKRGGYAWTLWMHAHLALVERPGANLPEATGPGSRFISRGQAGENFSLRFKFYDGAEAAAAYRQLVSKSGLAAWAVVDRETHRFLSVKFFHRGFPT
jgi:hypothetical protein